MIGKIFISSALIISLMFLASSISNSKSTIREAKEIQEHYELVKEIKTMIAKEYNIDPENISRDDIIAHLPKGENWEKILLLDRQKGSSLEDKEFVDESANISISEDEKIKVLALKAKLRDGFSNFKTEDDSLKIDVASSLKSDINYEKAFEKNVENTVAYIYSQILTTINHNSKTDSEISSSVDSFISSFLIDLNEKDKTKNPYVPFDQIKLDLTDDEKIELFKDRLRQKLEQNSVGYEQRAVKYLKGKI